MISFIQGSVESIHADSIVILTHGIGRKVFVSPSLLSSVRHGQDVGIHTELVVREDALTLFGFSSRDERDTFVALQSASGVGPKLAMAVLAVLTPGELAAAVENGDTKALTRVPGVGPKVAGRLVLELSGKITAAPTGAETAPQTGGKQGIIAEVVQALIGLGWKEANVQPVVEAAAEDDANSEVSSLLKASLRELGKKR